MSSGGLRLWAPALSMLLVSLISYVDRNTLALLSPVILEECRLSAEQYGWIISAFSVAYMAGNPLWGVWLDRWGVRKGMPLAVGFWSAASAVHALVSGFWGFAAARVALGFGEGATFPGGLRTVVQTLPEGLRSRGAAVAYSGGSLGAVLTPILIMPVYRGWGWRGAFLATGIAGAVWIVAWLMIERTWHWGPMPSATASQPMPWRDLRLWAFVSSYALGCLPLAFVLYQAPLYLRLGMGRSQDEIGSVLWIPPLGWEAGYFLWGWAVDRFSKGQADSLTAPRRLTMIAAVLTIPLAFTASVSSFQGTLALLFWAMFIAGGNVIVSLGYATRVFGLGRAGLIAGLGAGSWSAIVALSMPMFGRFADQRQFGAAFAAATGISILGYAGWTVLDGAAKAWPARPKATPSS